MPLDELTKRAREAKPDSHIPVSVFELRELAESNPSHPASEVFLKAADKRGERTERELYVERDDILGILENREVIQERKFEDDGEGNKIPVIRKRLGKAIEKKQPD